MRKTIIIIRSYRIDSGQTVWVGHDGHSEYRFKSARCFEVNGMYSIDFGEIGEPMETPERVGVGVGKYFHPCRISRKRAELVCPAWEVEEGVSVGWTYAGMIEKTN